MYGKQISLDIIEKIVHFPSSKTGKIGLNDFLFVEFVYFGWRFHHALWTTVMVARAQNMNMKSKLLRVRQKLCNDISRLLFFVPLQHFHDF